MPSIRLTELQIKNAKPSGARAQADLWDASLPGFSLRVTAKGTKTFSLKCRNADGVEQRVKIGRYPELSLADARKAALEAKVRISKGEIPAATLEKRRAPIITLSALTDEFLRRHASKNRTAAETERLLRREILGKFGARDFSTITKTEIIEVIEAIADRGKTALAVQTLAAVRKMFNWAISRDMLSRSPCEGIVLAKRSHPRDRVLEDVELAKVYHDCGGYPFGTIVKMLILTGQRRGEIAALKWDYVDQQQRTITLPASLTKNKRQHTFPYGDAVAHILTEIPQLGIYLFPARNNAKHVFSGWSKCKTALDNNCRINPWTLHDLRRTFATNLGALGTSVHVTEKLLNHVSGTLGGIVAVYQRHSYMDDMRLAVEAWEKRLSVILSQHNSDDSNASPRP